MIFPKELSFIFLLAILNFYSCSNLQLEHRNSRAPAGEGLILPESLNDIDKVKILLAINKEIPELFADASRFDVDIFKILEDQAKLQHLLLQNPRFLELWNQKQFISMEITIDDLSGRTLQTKQLASENVKKWKEKIYKKGKEILQSNLNLHHVTLDKISSMNKFSSAGFLNGLILNLPSTYQEEIRKLQKKTDLIQIELLLEKHLPNTLVNFRSDPPELNYSKEYLIKRWKNIFSTEKEAQTLMDLFLLTENRRVPLSIFIDQIDQLSDADFVALADPDYQKVALIKLFNNEKTKGINFYQNYLRKQLAQTEVVTSIMAEGYKIKLKEQNPNLAIFRGCTGGDCSSQNSFPYPNDPNERVFYIYDKENHLKGYLSGTMLKNNHEEKSFFINTIAGNRVNAIDTEMIFQAIYKERLALGVTSIILPNSKNLSSLINFPLVRSVYNDAIINQPETQIHYKEQELRKIIENFKSIHNVGDYDHMALNSSGVIYKPHKKNKLSLKTTINNIPNVFNIILASNDIDALSFLELRINLINSGKIEFAKRMTSAIYSESDLREMNEVIDLIQGKIILSIAEIEDKMNVFSNHFNISPLKLKTIKDKYLLNAYLLAKDAKDSRHLSNNIKRLLKDFKMTNTRPLIPRSNTAYQRWQEELQNTSEYEQLRSAYILILQHKLPAQRDIKDDLLRFSYALLKEPEGEFVFNNKQIHRIQKALPELKYFSSRVLREAISSRDINTLLDFSQKIFSSPYAASWGDLVSETLDAAIKFNDDQTLHNLIRYSLSQSHAEGWKDIASKILAHAISIKSPSLLRSFPTFVFSTPHASEWRDLLIQTIDIAIERKDTRLLSLIAEYAFLYPNSLKNKDLVTQLLNVSIQFKYTNVLSSLAKGVFSQEYSADWKDIFHRLIVESISLNSDEATNILMSNINNSHISPFSRTLELKDFFYKTTSEILMTKDKMTLRYIALIILPGSFAKEWSQLLMDILPLAIELKDHQTIENIKKSFSLKRMQEAPNLVEMISRYKNEEDFGKLKNEYYQYINKSETHHYLSCHDALRPFL